MTVSNGIRDDLVDAVVGRRQRARDDRGTTEANGTESDLVSAVRPLRVRWVTDALADPPAEPPVLVEGLLRAGELCAIAAPRGIGKSWWALNLAVLLGSGEGWLGGTLKVVRQARVLICQGEVNEYESARRWAMLTGSTAPPHGVAETFERWRLRTVRRRSSSSSGDSAGGRFNESDEWIDAVLDPRLEATVTAHHFDVIVLDPWAVFYAGAENSNDEVEAALDKLRDLAMRHQLAIVILHHLSKATDAREPEDLWRGASRLADWASTRVTLLPYYTPQQAADQGMTRQQARRYVNAHYLRRGTPTDDHSMVLDPTSGWWHHWTNPTKAADERRIHLETLDIVNALRDSGGFWGSTRAAAETFGIAVTTASKLLEAAERAGAIERFLGARNAIGWRIPGTHLSLVSDPEVDQ